MIISEEDYLMHYGILRKSGRYPWGSGETESERNRTFLDTINSMKKQGMSDTEITRAFHTKENPFTTSDLRALKSIALAQQKQMNISTAQKLKATGMSNVAIGKEMGINESSVRNLLAPGAAENADILKTTTDMLRRQVDDKKYIDVGSYVGNQLGMSDTKLKTAIAGLREEGYQIIYPKVPQVGNPGKFTNLKVLIHPDTPKTEGYNAAKNGQIRQIDEWSETGGRSFHKIQPPLNVNSSRVGITYKEDGGDKADGVIYIRPGVDDLSMGMAHYAQVRIAVDGTHYIKGMAVYKEGLPDGTDIQFNTNKSRSTNKLDALKPLKEFEPDKNGQIDATDPFGAVVRQLPKQDAHGNEIEGTVRSALNILNDEGQWDSWSKTLSTQFLSKQSPTLAKEQLDMTYERKKNELDGIKKLTNPAVKRQLLDSYADDADSSAIRMKAQAFPRQRTQVILPIPSLKETEVYAPNFNNGERVVLIRHPHGGTFEIPELTVNNRNKEGIATLGKQAKDAIGINAKVASRLSGADFDGDTVLVIPNNASRVSTSRSLEGLKDFDPQRDYKPYDGMKTIDGGRYNAATKEVDYHGKSPKGQTKQTQMGMISNLITDMTIKRASTSELAAAVRHSMVVIDAEKHHLDYKKSAIDNGISALVKKYQARDDGRTTGGASTLVSRAKQTVDVEVRRGRPSSEGGPIDRVTGQRKFVPTGETRIDRKTGEPVLKTEKASRLLEAQSAHELSSGTLIEKIYADHSDRVRELGNQARRESVNTKSLPYSPSAKETYAPLVKSLKAKLDIAVQNAPRERQAQVVANHIVSSLKAANPDMDKAEEKKIKSRALLEARARTGADKTRVDITDDEWHAIQSGAISNNVLEQILRNTDLDRVRELATPIVRSKLTPNMAVRARSMLKLGYTQADVAAQLGVSLSTLKNDVIDE